MMSQDKPSAMPISEPLTLPLRDLAAWSDHLSRIEIPVLPETVTGLAALAADEERADAQGIAEVVMRDPLMCVKLYRHMAQLRRGSQLTDVESVTGCIVMMGIPPFFRAFSDLRSATPPPGMTQNIIGGLNTVLTRAQRASAYAFDWAVRRNDLDAEIISIAALLHDFAEMLLWCTAPALAAQVREQLETHPGMRSSEAQRAVLNIAVDDLERELLARWHLPDLLVRIIDEHAGGAAQVRNVNLAVALARHSTNGWDNPALPDDYAALATLLNIPATQARLLVTDEGEETN
jgi:HD-like signal output (HDOD) protein